MSYGLYVITDERLSKGLTHVEIARRALQGGADVIQLRDKHMNCSDLINAAKEIRQLTKGTSTLFIVNDRLDVALISGADGVHLGQKDIPVKFAKKISPPGLIIGVSASTVEEAVKAESEGADYIGMGPVYNTSSKSDAEPACGIDALREACDKVSIPVVAIGGIGMNNAREVLEAGADGIAVISAVVSQDDVTKAANELKEIIKKYIK
jgi:thiamine-phosphate pyrophosphorylase